MPMPDLISEKRLIGMHPKVIAQARVASAALAMLGTYFRVVAAFRTYAEEDALYAQGRTTPGHIVTDVRGGFSNHNFAMAIDCCPFLKGSTGDINFKVSTPQFQAMVKALKDAGFAWGGDWTGTLHDYDHFQLANIPVTPTNADRAAFANGGLPRVWALYDHVQSQGATT